MGIAAIGIENGSFAGQQFTIRQFDGEHFPINEFDHRIAKRSDFFGN